MMASPFRSDCLQGRVCLITGGGSGIGFEITRQLLFSGCSVAVICGRRESFLKSATELLQKETNKLVHYQVCDVRKPEQCQAVADFIQQTFRRLDILVNGAAGNFLAPANELSPKGFETVLRIDAMGTFNMSRACYKLLHTTSKYSDTNIINISATLQNPATFWQVHASAAKAAVDSLTRSLALEWGPIRVNGVAPGPIAHTPGTTKLAPLFETNMLQGIPLGRLGEASEIGQAVIFVCTNSYMTGHTMVVDGGECLYKAPLVNRASVAELSRAVETKSRAQAPQLSKL